MQSKEDMGNVGMETPVKQSLELRGSSASSMLPPLSHTPGSLSPSGRPQKKKKRHYNQCREADGGIPEADCRGYGNYAHGNGGSVEAD